MPKPEVTKVAIYARVSTDEKPDRKDKTQDPENQLAELRAFCHRSGWEIYDEYIDRASGAKGRKDRPRFDQMFTDASRRHFDLVLFWALDRFSREGTLITLKHLEELNSWRVDWRSFQEPYIDSCGPFREVVIALMATLAKQERIRISQRTRAGLEGVRREIKANGFRIGKRSGKPFTQLGRPRVEVDHAILLKLRKSGLSLRQIAGETSLSVSSVARALKEAA